MIEYQLIHSMPWMPRELEAHLYKMAIPVNTGSPTTVKNTGIRTSQKLFYFL